MKCRKCKCAVGEWEIFPGFRCLKCFEACPETQRAVREMTAEKLAKMWSGRR